MKHFIVTIGIILALLSIIFGSLLPLAKSQRFILALRSVSSVKTIDEFKANFDRAFKFYSPVGDEEIAKFLSGNILQMMSQENQPEAVSRELVNYIEPYLFQNNVRHLLGGGNMYLQLWFNRGRGEEDFLKSESYYRKALAIGPKLPPALYGMLDLYRLKGDTENMKKIGEIILKYWPEDEKIKELK